MALKLTANINNPPIGKWDFLRKVIGVKLKFTF